MWMVEESNDHGKELMKISTVDPIYGRNKLRPLMPRPTGSCNASCTPFSTISTSSSCCFHNPNILSWTHAISGLSDYGVHQREIHTVPLVSTRWNPTAEQLQALEEMYRRGTRTPSAEQIQQIAAKLRRFGKIEGKNVFYWFQNHKARERQKKRRQLELQLAGKKIQHVETLETKKTGLSRRNFDIENNEKLLPSPSNCSTPSEDSASMHGAVIAECKRDGWTQKIVAAAKNETCWNLDLSSSRNNRSRRTITAHGFKAFEQENAEPFVALNYNLGILLPPKIHNGDDENIIERENQTTLQLFPTASIGFSTVDAGRHEEEIDQLEEVSSMGSTKYEPNEFIEFLPTKK